MQNGKIIAVVGAPRTGKTFLARKLASHYGAEIFLEGEDGGKYPKWIQDSIAKDTMPLQRTLWFRSKLVESYLKALRQRASGKTVVLDVFWLSNHMYIDTLLAGVERDLMWQVSKIDKQILDLPDLVIFLKISEAGIRQFLKSGGREFDQSEDYLRNVILPVSRVHEQFFERPDTGVRVLTVDRDDLDFDQEADFRSVTQQIDTALAN